MMAHQSTTEYLATAAAQRAATHAEMRALVRATSKAAASLQAGVAQRRGAFAEMQLDEADPAIAGHFVELLDILKTIDRLGGELHHVLTQLPGVLDREEAMAERIQSACTPATPEPTPPVVPPDLADQKPNKLELRAAALATPAEGTT